MPKTRSDHWLEAKDSYCKATGKTTFYPPDVAEWAMQNLGYSLSLEEIAIALTKQLKSALQNDKDTSPSGKTYRTNVCAQREVVDEDTGEIVQRWFWSSVEDAEYGFVCDSVREMSYGVYDTNQGFKNHVAGLNEVKLQPGEEPFSDEILPRPEDDDADGEGDEGDEDF